MMRRQPYLRGLVLQNGMAELTLNSDPGTGDPADDGPAARRRQQEADLWNRLLEGLPAKAKAAGVEVSQDRIPLEEVQGLKQTGKEEAFVQSFTIRGSEKDLTRFLSQEEALRPIVGLKDETPKNTPTETFRIVRWLRGLMDKIQDGSTPGQAEKSKASPLRFVLVEHAEEVLNDLFPDAGGPTSTTGRPTPPSSPGNTSPGEFRAGTTRRWTETCHLLVTRTHRGSDFLAHPRSPGTNGSPPKTPCTPPYEFWGKTARKNPRSARSPFNWRGQDPSRFLPMNNRTD
jgi:hypothetical protein